MDAQDLVNSYIESGGDTNFVVLNADTPGMPDNYEMMIISEPDYKRYRKKMNENRL